MKKYIGLLILLIALPINLQATQIGTKQIKDQAITTAKIDDEAVNDTKLEAVLKARIPTTDEKAAMTGANSPSAANVLATMDDITGLDSGVQTVTDGDFITNSGTAKNPILDVDVDDSSEANTQLWTAEKITSELAGKVDQADSALIQHNDLLGKQGGTVDEYYHMTNAQHTRIDELESTDTPVFASINIGSNYQFPPDIGTAAQILKVPAAGTVLEWGAAAAGYTNLTEFVDQTAWRLFYSDTDGDVTELAFGADGTYLMSNGEAVAPTFETPAGDVVGPAEAVDNRIVVFDGVTGKLVKDSGSLISDLLDTADSTLFVWHDGSIDFTANQSMGGFKITNADEAADDSDYVTLWGLTQGLAGKQATGDYLEDSEFASAGLMKTDGAGNYSIVTDESVAWQAVTDKVEADSASWDAAYSLKGVLDALNGLVKCDGSGNYSAVTDNSSDWNTVTDKLDLTDTAIFALVASGRPFTGGQDFQDGIQADTILESTIGSGVTIEEVQIIDDEVVVGTWKATVVGAQYGGTGLATLTAHKLLVGNGTSAANLIDVGTNGQMLLGQNTADPTWQTMDTDATMDETGTVIIAAEAVTYAKMQHISGSDKILGRVSGAGDVEEIACTATGRAILAANAYTRYLHWSPAYNGYALSADGGSNDAGDSGIIVAFAGTLGDSDNNDTPYIEWSSTEAGVSDYDMIIKIPIPADYSSMTTFRVEYDSDTVQEDTATVSLYDSNDDADSSVVLSSSTWAVDETMQPSGTYTAGEHMTIKLHLEAAEGQSMRIGEIRCSYVATR